MSPQDNSDLEDFVYIDNFVLSIRCGHRRSNTFSSPIETDYVTVDNDNSAMFTDENTLMTPAPDEDKQPMVHIEYFEPMLLSAFPEELNKYILMASIPPEHQAAALKLTRPSSTDSPHSFLVKNAILLLECFFHFESIYPKIGRDLVLYTVGKGCELSSVGASTPQQQIERIVHTLSESRKAFLRRTKHTFVLRAEDHNVRELARLVDRYINFKPEEPQVVDKRWHTVEGLWIDWQYILQSKGLRMTKDQTDSGKYKTTCWREHWLTLWQPLSTASAGQDLTASVLFQKPCRLPTASIKL